MTRRSDAGRSLTQVPVAIDSPPTHEYSAHRVPRVNPAAGHPRPYAAASEGLGFFEDRISTDRAWCSSRRKGGVQTADPVVAGGNTRRRP